MTTKYGKRKLQIVEAEPQTRLLPPMPISVIHSPMPVAVSLEKEGAVDLFRFRYAECPHPSDELEFDPFATRDHMLQVRTPVEAYEFLTTIADFFQTTREPDQEQTHLTLTWPDFQKWQRVVRFVMVWGFIPQTYFDGTQAPDPSLMDLRPDDLAVLRNLSVSEHKWLTGHEPDIQIQSDLKGAALHVNVYALSVLEVALATVYVDRLLGVRYQKCALRECDTMFPSSPSYGRQFCSPAHAQKASARQRRHNAKLKTSAAGV